MQIDMAVKKQKNICLFQKKNWLEIFVGKLFLMRLYIKTMSIDKLAIEIMELVVAENFEETYK